MSLPPELRVLCFHLSSTPAVELPRLIPTLLLQVLRCEVPLSTPAGNSAKNDASATSVLVHKLKTQLTTLLNGKSPEGRLAAVVLIKGVVEVGGWEVLQGSEPWVRGLLSVLGKPDSAATKELCIMSLTKIYCMTHQYQTLVREITTPTLPNFVTACLNIISSKASGKFFDIPSSLTEVIFRSFAALLPHHTTIYRPFVSQIRTVAKPYLAPTLSDSFVSSSLKQSARCIVVALHQTIAKNAGGEEWGKAVRDIVKEIHVTGDQVFRAVVEDWESVAGYISEPVDVSQEPSGGGKTSDDLPRWTGIADGVERMTGLLGLLEGYFKNETSTPISIPLGVVMDLATRILSIAIPSSSPSGHSDTRLHPAIERDERDVLWSALPGIYVATIQVLSALADRLQVSFLPLAQTLLDQITWVFPSGKHDQDFRLITYQILVTLLLHVGPSLGKKESSRLSVIIKSCCQDISPNRSAEKPSVVNVNGKRPLNHNADSFTRLPSGDSHGDNNRDSKLVIAANEVLPVFMSHVPQQYLDISIRSLIERTAILNHNKEAMLASILNPFIGKNGKSITSILPHLTRDFSNDATVELLLRPRLPMVPSTTTRALRQEGAMEPEDEDTDMILEPDDSYAKSQAHHPHHPQVDTVISHHGLGHSSMPSTNEQPGGLFGTGTSKSNALNPQPISLSTPHPAAKYEVQNSNSNEQSASSQVVGDLQDHGKGEEESDSDDESVHLTMGLDTDSESDE